MTPASYKPPGEAIQVACLTIIHKLLEACRTRSPDSRECAIALFRYDQVRLLAPIAELRMLVAGLSGFINPQSLA